MNDDMFWAKVDRSAGADGCWLWTGAARNGYGHLHRDGHWKGSHRVAYELLVGRIPDGLVLDHLCRTPSCVNPAHLEPVTQAENLLRSPLTLNARSASRTSCPQGHPYDEANTDRREGHRRCRTCRQTRPSGVAI